MFVRANSFFHNLFVPLLLKNFICFFLAMPDPQQQQNSLVRADKSVRTPTCSSRDLASSETDSGMLRAVWRPIPAGWQRSSDCSEDERRGGAKDERDNHQNKIKSKKGILWNPLSLRFSWEQQNWKNRRRPKSESTWNNTDHSNQAADVTAVREKSTGRREAFLFLLVCSAFLQKGLTGRRRG